MTDAKTFTLEDKLSRTGVRMTAPRRAQQIDPGISLATVYRTVRLFEQLGIVERHAFSAGRARYEQPGDEHHDHFVNVRTGEVIEFHAPEIEELQAVIARRHGYKIHDHRLVIYVEPLDEGES